MALQKLATLWKVDKRSNPDLVLAGSSRDDKETYFVFKSQSRDGKYTFYNLCRQVPDSEGNGRSSNGGGNSTRQDVPF